jgi:hypothetical protein
MKLRIILARDKRLFADVFSVDFKLLEAEVAGVDGDSAITFSLVAEHSI